MGALLSALETETQSLAGCTKSEGQEPGSWSEGRGCHPELSPSPEQAAC